MKVSSRRQFLGLGLVGLGTTMVLAACNLQTRPTVAVPVLPAGGVAPAPAAAPQAAVAPAQGTAGGHVMAPRTAQGIAHLAFEPALPTRFHLV